MARPPYEPTGHDRELVKRAVHLGFPQEKVAQLLNVDAKTLRKHFREELDQGSGAADAAVLGSLYDTALYSKDERAKVTAAIFWCKTRLGMRETERVELTGKDGGAIEATGSFAFPQLQVVCSSQPGAVAETVSSVPDDSE